MTRIDSNPNATYAREQMESTERAQEKQREENMRSERISEERRSENRQEQVRSEEVERVRAREENKGVNLDEMA